MAKKSLSNSPTQTAIINSDKGKHIYVTHEYRNFKQRDNPVDFVTEALLGQKKNFYMI